MTVCITRSLLLLPLKHSQFTYIVGRLFKDLYNLSSYNQSKLVIHISIEILHVHTRTLAVAFCDVILTVVHGWTLIFTVV